MWRIFLIALPQDISNLPSVRTQPCVDTITRTYSDILLPLNTSTMLILTPTFFMVNCCIWCITDKIYPFKSLKCTIRVREQTSTCSDMNSHSLLCDIFIWLFSTLVPTGMTWHIFLPVWGPVTNMHVSTLTSEFTWTPTRWAGVVIELAREASE